MKVIKLDSNNDYRLKKEATQYQSMSHAKFTFDQVRRLQSINGNVVLRGKQGRRDTIYPLPTACKRFARWYPIWVRWEQKGFHVQSQQLKLVLQDLGVRIRQAVKQRLAGQWDGFGGFANSVVPDAKFIAQLEKALAVLGYKL